MKSALFSALEPARMSARGDSNSGGRRGCNRFKRPARRRRCRRNRRSRSRTN